MNPKNIVTYSPPTIKIIVLPSEDVIRTSQGGSADNPYFDDQYNF